MGLLSRSRAELPVRALRPRELSPSSPAAADAPGTVPAHDALTIGSWQTPIVTRAGAFDPSRASRPFAPFHHLTAELASSEGRDNKPSLGERGICPSVAGATEGDEVVEVKIGAALGTLAHVVDF